MAQEVRALIKCALCRKPRCIYPNTKLTGNVKANVEFIISDGEYACGGSFTDDESYLRHAVVVRRQLTCTSPLETMYFSAKIGFPVVCCQCGGASGAPLVDDDETKALKRKFTVVRSVCSSCKRSRLEPMTRAPKFDDPKNKKKK